MQLHSIAAVDCLLTAFGSQHRVEQWIDDPNPYEWEFQDAVDLNDQSPDGGVYGMSRLAVGGFLTIKVLGSSPTTQWCIQQELMRSNAVEQRTILPPVHGSLLDLQNNVSWRMEGGVIVMFPRAFVLGQDYEARMYFQRITPNVDGGIFHPVFANQV